MQGEAYRKWLEDRTAYRGAVQRLNDIAPTCTVEECIEFYTRSFPIPVLVENVPHVRAVGRVVARLLLEGDMAGAIRIMDHVEKLRSWSVYNHFPEGDATPDAIEIWAMLFDRETSPSPRGAILARVLITFGYEYMCRLHPPFAHIGEGEESDIALANYMLVQFLMVCDYDNFIILRRHVPDEALSQRIDDPYGLFLHRLVEGTANVQYIEALTPEDASRVVHAIPAQFKSMRDHTGRTCAELYVELFDAPHPGIVAILSPHTKGAHQ